MELFTLNSNNERLYLYDNFESLVWTERYSDYGDFQIDVISNEHNRRVLREGFKVQIEGSRYLMTIETVEDHTDAEGQRILTARGRSLEAIFLDRLARQNRNDLATNPKWSLFDQPHTLARWIFRRVCLDGVLSVADILPGVVMTAPDGANRIPYPPDDVRYEIEPQTLYEAIQGICKPYDLGFRLIWASWDSVNDYRYQVYTGYDRTTAQTANSQVVFSMDLDNMSGVTTLSTIQGAKNTAYVAANEGFRIVYPPGTTGASGWRRNVLYVNVTDVPEGLTQVEINEYLDQRGQEELAKNRAITIFDGEITQNSQYVYGRDYELGDLVELRDLDRNQKTMIVTEQIFVHDKEGERSYPTLSELTYIEDQLIDP